MSQHLLISAVPAWQIPRRSRPPLFLLPISTFTPIDPRQSRLWSFARPLRPHSFGRQGVFDGPAIETPGSPFCKAPEFLSFTSTPFIMLLPKGGVTWKSARARLPPWRAVLVLLTRTRFLVTIAVTGLVILLWRGVSKSASEMQKYEHRVLAWLYAVCVLTCVF